MCSGNVFATKDSEKDSTLSDNEREFSQNSTISNQILIVVKIFDDTAITLSIDKSDLVSKIKAMIEERKGIAADQYQLIFKGKQLEDDKLLFDYGIQNESFIQMIPNDAKIIQFSVMNNDGKTFTMKMDINDTFKQFKLKIRDDYDIPLDRQCFTCFDERTMYNENDEMEEVFESIKEVRADIAAINGALENINFVSNNVNDQDFDFSSLEPEEEPDVSDDDNCLPTEDSSPESSSDEDDETDSEDGNEEQVEEGIVSVSNVNELRPTQNSSQSNITKNYKFVTKMRGKKELEYLCVFTNDERTHCYYYTWNTSKNSYVCNICYHLKSPYPYVWAKLKNENGEEYVELSINQHKCEPKVFQERTIVKLPNYQIDDEELNGKMFQYLKVFIGDGKYYKYTYQKFENVFRCSQCANRKVNPIYVIARIKNVNGEECIEMGDNQHVCKPKSI